MSILATRRVWLPLVLVLLIALPFGVARAFLGAPASAAPAVLGSQILEVHDGSLTSYQAGATSSQDVKPGHLFRGVGVDGAQRAGAAHGMHLAGNPFGSPWSGKRTLSGVDLATGSYSIHEIDLAFPNDGPAWPIGRSYSQVQDTGSHTSDGYQGKNWFQVSQPEIQVHWEVAENTKDADDVLYIVYGAERFIELQRLNVSSDLFKAVNGAAGVAKFEANGSNPDTYTYTDQWGYKFTFFGFNGDDAGAEGLLWKVADPSGEEAYAGSDTLSGTTITDGYASGRISTAFDSEGRRYSYTYAADAGSTQRLTEVLAEELVASVWTTVGKVEYAYYGDESYGDTGDLKLVTITEYLSEASNTLEKKKYYRYWEGTYNASTNPGHPHSLKFAYDFEGLRRFDWTDATFDEDFLTASNTSLEEYATAYLEYDSTRRVNEGWFNGDCGCSGGGNGTHTITYEDNTGYSDGTGYDTEWASRTEVAQPDGSYLVQYFDEVGQELHRVDTDGTPGGGSTLHWATSVERDSQGAVTTVATPANIGASGYDHATGVLTQSTSAGLINHYARVTTGQMKGFASAALYSQGSGGDQFYSAEMDYSSTDIAVSAVGPGTVDLVRPSRSSYKEFYGSSTTGAGGYNATSTTYTWHTDSLMMKEVTVQHPPVVTNGPGVASTEKWQYDMQGRVQFYKEREFVSGVASDAYSQITYSEYEAGTMVKRVEDADLSLLSGTPTWTNATSAAHQETLWASKDSNGLAVTELPSGRATCVYTSQLQDGRRLAMSYPRYEASIGKYFGPVHFQLQNQAGNTESSGVIALDESTAALSTHIDETASDVLSGIGIGEVSALEEKIYNNVGSQLVQARVYNSIPSTYPGSDGIHYDQAEYGYSLRGEVERTAYPTGTILRTTHDARGRAVARYIGTNDSTFVGGSASGVDDMVKAGELEYDNGAVGNGSVTQHTAYTEGSSANARVTTYQYSVQGHLLLTTNPEAPHVFLERDNLGRVLAAGVYSGTSSITLAGDLPTTEASGRMALAEAKYDSLGRTCTSTWHKVDPSDGTSEDTLVEDVWFDAKGARIKVDGEGLQKFAYDRLGRLTHTFVLAETDDSTYGDVVDVAGDIVLEEHQTVYESLESERVAMDVKIARQHNDIGTSETEGPLDANADGTLMTLSPSDLGVGGSGQIPRRPQITAYWYDSRDRLVEAVRYGHAGTYGSGAASFVRTGLSLPARSETELRTSYIYGDDGHVAEVVDPLGRTRRTERDSAGNVVTTIQNYTGATPPIAGSQRDKDIYTRYSYKDGLLASQLVDLDGNGSKDADDQETTYVYGTSKGVGSGASLLGSGHLLREMAYPDSSGATDVISYAYNVQGEEIYREDPAGNIMEYIYDGMGRRTNQSASTISAGYVSDVRRIASTYDSAGRLESLTQYDSPVVGAGNVIDETQFSFDHWGNTSRMELDRDSEVGAAGSLNAYTLEYAFEKAGASKGRNTVRCTSLTYPSGKLWKYQYLSGGGRHDAATSRVTRIAHGSTSVVSYDYMGVEETVGAKCLPVGVKRLQYVGSDYDGRMDRFNRWTEDTWFRGASTTAVHDVVITYNANAQITSLDDRVHKGFDVLVELDDLGRITRTEEGTLATGTIVSAQRDKAWELDRVGNWAAVALDLNADSDFDDAGEYDEVRTFNKANGLATQDYDNDAVVDGMPDYDAVGALVDDDQQYEWGYDAWGRLCTIHASGNLVAEYRYNGLGYRIGEHLDTDRSGSVDGSDAWTYYMFNAQWQRVATFQGGDSDPTEEYYYHTAGLDGRGGSSHVDAIIMRDRDTDGDAVMEERMWFFQNWRQDVVAIVDDAHHQVEMVRYSAYGVPFGLPAGDWDSDGDNDTVDHVAIQNAIGGTGVLGDIDLDGDIDAADHALASSSPLRGENSGIGVLSGRGGNTIGFQGLSVLVDHSWSARTRVLSPYLGSWRERDRLDYIDGPNLYNAMSSNPYVYTDPLGTQGISSTGGGEGELPPIVIEGPEVGRIPPCPLTEPGAGTGDKWCIDCAGVGHCELKCYRSFGTGTRGGQQCCYDEDGYLNQEPGCMGTIDRVGGANGQGKDGCCTQDARATFDHMFEDAFDYYSNKSRYKDIQECMRAKGIPSGSPAGDVHTGHSSPGAGGVTDEEMEKAYRECSKAWLLRNQRFTADEWNRIRRHIENNGGIRGDGGGGTGWPGDDDRTPPLPGNA